MDQWIIILRWILMIPMIALCVWATLFNWSIIYREFIKRDEKVPSVATFGGEIFGIIAIVLCPAKEIQKFWWIPVVFGGMFVYILTSFIFSITQKFRKT